MPKTPKQISVIYIILSFLLILPSILLGSDTNQNTNYKVEINGKSIKRTLTDQSFTGTPAQASLLLSFLKDYPNFEDYQILKEEFGEVTLFGCNLKKNVIIRVHQRENGHGSQEMWKDHVLYRLNAAKNGGTLNHTPTGKIYGVFQAF